MKAGRKATCKKGYVSRKHYGFCFYHNKFIFGCPCGALFSSKHRKCKKFYDSSQRNQYKRKVSTAMSKEKLIEYIPVYKYLVFPIKIDGEIILDKINAKSEEPLTNFKLSVFAHYNDAYYHISDKYKLILYYAHIAKISFRYSINKKLQSNILVVNNSSTYNIDRSNINFNVSYDKLISKYKIKNIYYLKLFNMQLLNDINQYYNGGGKYKQYQIHEYEQKNKIKIPVTSYTKNITPSYPLKYPNYYNIKKLQVFIRSTEKYVLPVPKAPDYYDPFSIKHTYILDKYFENVNIDYYGPPPIVSYEEAVTKVEALFPNKKYLKYQQYKDARCYFCWKKGHLISLCEETIDKSKIFKYQIKKLVEFIMEYPTRMIQQRYGTYDGLIWLLLAEYDKLEFYVHQFWSDFYKKTGCTNPFADFNEYWTFGDYRRRNIGFWWAIGASRVYLLKLTVGYESKKCSYIPRMQLLNHKSLLTYNKEALIVLHEYISFGILKIIPESAARVILPMSCIVKKLENGTTKTRIVVDGKPINCYTPAMKFTPNKIENVKSTIFPRSRVLTQDAMHAFFQLKCTPEQALYQCVKFYYPPAGKEIVCCFTTEFFGGKLSCYRYKKLEDVINNYFKLMGIQMNAFYDDAAFYAQDDSLHAAVLGSFIKRIYYGCGRLLKESKTDLLYGSYIFKFCGFQWNSKLMMFQPLEKLIISIQLAIDEVISNIGLIIPIKLLVSIIGKLVYAGIAINIMSILLSPLKELLRGFHRQYGQEEIWTKSFRVSQYLCDHLGYLKQFVTLRHVVPIVVKKCDIEVVSDVSDRIAGSHDSQGMSIAVPLSLNLCKASSTLRELYGAYVAILNRLDKLKGKNVRLLIDNLGAVTVLMRNGSKLYDMNQLIYKIVRLCADNNITLWARWLRRDTQAIVFADDLSKCTEVDRWLFDVELLNYIIDTLQLPTITIDLLADNNNKIVNRYYSRYADGYSLGYNWLQFSYKLFKNEICYLNPPFRGDYLSLAIQHIIMKEINTYIILPLWPSAPWYLQVIQQASYIIELPDCQSYFYPPPYMTLRTTKNWRLLFVLFLFPRRKTKKCYRYNPMTLTLSLIRTF